MASAFTLRGFLRMVPMALATLAGCGAPITPQAQTHDTVPLERAQALIDATANGGAAFRVHPAGAVLHIQSGMICGLGSQEYPLTSLVVVPGSIPGDDAGCDYENRKWTVTIFATRLGSATFGSHVAGTVSMIARVEPDARETDGPLVAYGEDWLPPDFAKSYAIRRAGRDYVTSVWMGEERGWVVKLRATYPAETRNDSEVNLEAVSAAMFLYIRQTVRDHGAP